MRNTETQAINKLIIKTGFGIIKFENYDFIWGETAWIMPMLLAMEYAQLPVIIRRALKLKTVDTTFIQ